MRKIGIVVALALLLVTGFSLTSVSADVAKGAGHLYSLKGGHGCDPVQHEPRTDYTSYDIKVRGIKCGVARRWLRKGGGGFGRVPKAADCESELHADGLTHTDFMCTFPGKKNKAMVWATS